MEINYKRIISIYFSYNTTVNDTIKIDISNKRSKGMRTKEVFYDTLDNSTYKQYISTNTKSDYVYSFEHCTQDVLDFFKNAVDAEKLGYSITHGIEEDAGTINEYQCVFRNFFWDERTVTVKNGQKIYKNVSIEVIEV